MHLLWSLKAKNYLMNQILKYRKNLERKSHVEKKLTFLKFYQEQEPLPKQHHMQKLFLDTLQVFQ
jgi:hypothetical protein